MFKIVLKISTLFHKVWILSCADVFTCLVDYLKLFKTQLYDIKNNVWLLFLYKLNLHAYLNGLVC